MPRIEFHPEWIIPDWPAPNHVRALVTTRAGGVSVVPWDSLNLGNHVNDDPAAVTENRRRLSACLPQEPLWLQQVHGVRCVDAANGTAGCEADASFTRQPGVVCAVMTADCLPILLCDAAGSVVAAAHAGWRGLLAGVIESTVTQMAVAPETLLAWIGPAIGPTAFEVGAEVRDSFLAHAEEAATAFAPHGTGKFLCNLSLLATQRLNALGVRRITATDFCTASDASRFFSYRRDGQTGRMASCIWLEPSA